MRHPTLYAYALLATATLSWGGNIVIGRAVRNELPPVGLNFWRWLLCFLILLIFTGPHLRENWPVIRREWKLLLVLALFGIASYNSLQYQALHTTTAINATLIAAVCPALMALLSVLVLKDRLNSMQIVGITVSFIGAAIVIVKADMNNLLSIAFTRGDLWMLAAVMVWAVYSIAVKLRPEDLNPLIMLTVITGMGALILLPFYLWESLTIRTMPVTPQSLMTIGYVTFIASLLAYVCYNKGVSLIGPAKAGIAIHLMPVWVAILAFIFLGERLESYHLVGITLILTGIILNNRKPKSKA